MANLSTNSFVDGSSEEFIAHTAYGQETKLLQELAARKCPYSVPKNSTVIIPEKVEKNHEKETAGLVRMELRELLQIALGSGQMNSVNYAILFSLLKILLKKLGCESEIVTIGGFEGQCVEKLLNASKPSPLPFNDERVNILADKIKRFEETEHRAKQLEELYFKHLKDIQRSRNVPPLIMNFAEWEMYNQPCEDVYMRCDPDSEVACELLHNTDFLRKLMRRMAFPMVERIFQLEEKLEKLSQQLQELIDEIKRQMERLLLIDAIVEEIEKVKALIQNNYVKFINAIEEVQDMLDSKLDKVHMPALKKYLKESFANIEKRIEDLQSQHDCSKAAGIITNGLTCMSCGNSHVCANKGEIPVATLPALRVVCCDLKKYKKRCGCYLSVKPGEPPITERLNAMNMRKLDENSLKPKSRLSCQNTLVAGVDGNLYRGDLNSLL